MDTRDRTGDEVVILGGGLAGLSCGFHLDEAGLPWRILEAEDRPGGLARSETREGYTFDATGHWLHLRDPGIRALVESLLGDDLLSVERSAWIRSHDTFVPYPFQTNTWALPSEVTYECLMGFIEAHWGRTEGEAPRTFREHVERTLGRGIAQHFMLPYNAKLWTVDLDELSLDWMGRFVPQPSAEEVVRGAVGARTGPQGYNARFVYPRAGGIETLPRRLAERLRGPVETGARAVSIDPDGRTVKTADGRVFPWRRLVSSLPLPALVGLVEGVPEAVRAAAGRLRATQVTYVNVAVRVPPDAEPLPYQWVYFPDPEVPFYRAGCASAAVPSLAPPDGRTFYVEFSHRRTLDPQACEREAVEGLRRAGLLREEDEVLFSFARTIPVAYVIFDHAHGDARRDAQAWLAERDIHCIGRYGRWDYASMEDALMDGREIAGTLAREGADG